jgi:expansin (peptidoglycan-binding protein)
MKMKNLISLFFCSLLFSVINCAVLEKRGVGKINDFDPYPEVKKDVEKNIANYKYNFYQIFKDGPIFTGEGTAYGNETSNGNCSFPKDEYYSDMMYAALNSKQYDDSFGCGLCAVVVSTNAPYKPIRVRVIDKCPECKHGDLDFSDIAYKALTNKEPGRKKITWALIPCDIDIAGYPALVKPGSDVRFQFKHGSTNSWTEIKVYNSRYPIAKVAVKIGDKFVDLTRSSYNYWYRKGQPGLGAGPFDFRVELADGSIVNASGVEFKPQKNDEDSIFSVGKKQTVTGSTGKIGYIKRLIKTIFQAIIIIVVVIVIATLVVLVYNKFHNKGNNDFQNDSSGKGKRKITVINKTPPPLPPRNSEKNADIVDYYTSSNTSYPESLSITAMAPPPSLKMVPTLKKKNDLLII